MDADCPMIRTMDANEAVAHVVHRACSLDRERPVLRGNSQNPDTFIQSHEAVEPFYAAFPGLLDDALDCLGQSPDDCWGRCGHEVLRRKMAHGRPRTSASN